MPKFIRDALLIQPYDQVTITLEAGFVKVQPTKDVLDLAGTLSAANKKTPPNNQREQLESHYERV